MSKKFSSTVAGASIIITIFTLFGRALGFLREVVFAGYFGLNRNFEIYLVAAVLPNAINIVLLVLAQNYFIPNYYKFDSADKKDFFTHSINSFLFSSLILTLILFFFSDFIIDHYVNTASIQARGTASIIFKIFLITIPLTAVISVLYAFLQAEKKFTAPIVSNLFTNIFIIFAVPFFTDNAGVFIIPISYLAGIAAQAVFLVIIANKKIKIKISPYFFKTAPQTMLGNFFFLTLLIELGGQMFVIVDRFFLNKVQQGGIAALNYSSTLFQLPIVILPFAVATVLFPSFSELIRRSDLGELKIKVEKSIASLTLLTTLISFVFIFFGDFLIDLLFRRGNFSLNDASLTFQTFRIYSISLVFYSIYSVLNKLLYSANLLKLLLLIVIFSLLLKFIFIFFLVDKIYQNGLALSTSISNIFLCFACMFTLQSFKLKLASVFFKNLAFYSINGFISLLITIIFAVQIKTSGMFTGLLQIFLFSFLFLINCFVCKDDVILLFYNSFIDFLKIKFLNKMPA
ncbi:MAG TPA: lipid II flippase MurJ [Ignavibacteriaceae bacterium]|nr:lipid II flippase MurJ [Ignavibacteriaceae bacterium]